jgi:hypothetical protein
MDEEKLKELNERIGKAESEGDEEFLREVLADELVFRRASGKVVTKEEFLAEVQKNKSERQSKDIKVNLDEERNTALVSLIVRVMESEFKNLRVFVRNENEWQCLMWFNTKIS